MSPGPADRVSVMALCAPGAVGRDLAVADARAVGGEPAPVGAARGGWTEGAAAWESPCVFSGFWGSARGLGVAEEGVGLPPWALKVLADLWYLSKQPHLRTWPFLPRPFWEGTCLPWRRKAGAFFGVS